MTEDVRAAVQLSWICKQCGKTTMQEPDADGCVYFQPHDCGTRGREVSETSTDWHTRWTELHDTVDSDARVCANFLIDYDATTSPA